MFMFLSWLEGVCEIGRKGLLKKPQTLWLNNEHTKKLVRELVDDLALHIALGTILISAVSLSECVSLSHFTDY